MKGFVAAGFLLFCIHTQAQQHAYFDHIWQQEGLSQSQVLSIAQDNQGFVWLGTQDGLNRYDGSHIKTFHFEPFNKSSLSDDYIWNIQFDGDSLLWINSQGKLDVMNCSTQKIKHIHFAARPKITIIRTWCVGTQVYAWSSEGIAKVTVKGNRGSLQPFSLEIPEERKKNFYVFSMCADPHGNVLAATSLGLYLLPKDQQSFIAYSSHYVLSSLFSRPIRSIFVRDTRLFFSARNTFYIFNTQTGQTDSVSTGNVTGQYVAASGMDRYGKIWLGTNGNGLFCLAPKNNTWTVLHYTDNKTQFGLTCNYITSIYCSQDDRFDQVWIGSRDAGLYSFSPYKNIFKLHSAFTDKPHDNFFGVVKDRQGNIWAGTQEGIHCIHPIKGHSYFIDLKNIVRSERPFESIYCDNNDDVWIGNANTLYRVDKQNRKLVPVWEEISPAPFNHVLRVTALNNETLLLGTRHGYATYNKKTRQGKLVSKLPINGREVEIGSVAAFAPDENGNVWMGTSTGLIFLDGAGKNNQRFVYKANDRNSLLTDWILDVRVHPNGTVYIATSKGISAMNPARAFGKFVQFNHTGLKSRFIYGILFDRKGNLWMPTNSGISVFNPVTGSFRTYHSYQGVQLTEFNSGGFSQTPDGELLFAGIGGIVGIYPRVMQHKAPAPMVYMQSMRLNGNQVITSTVTRLQYYENNIELQFSVLDFYSAQDVVLKYRVNKNRKKWISLQRGRTLSLANLAPGNYTLEVIGENADGVLSPQPFTWSFVILPPFWNAGWFYALMALFLLIAAYFTYRLRLRRKLRIYRSIQQAREQEAEKSRKAAALDLHDEFGNGLTRISMMIQMVKNKTPENQTEQREWLDTISDHSQRLYQGTKDFIWSIRPGNNNAFEAVIRIKDHADELLYNTGIKFDVEGLTEDLLNLKHDPSTGRNLTMIFQEALYNILKHAQASCITLTVFRTTNALVMRLTDDGKGFEVKPGGNSFGIGNMKQRASRIGATVEIHSEKNKGSQVTVTIPLSLYEKNSSY